VKKASGGRACCFYFLLAHSCKFPRDVQSPPVADQRRYVAMHAMQEDSSHDHSTSNGYAEGGGSQRNKPKPQMKDTLAAVGGMFIPLLTQLGHHH
jgi:hypothetical protein